MPLLKVKLPDDSVALPEVIPKFPDVKVTLPAVRVKFLPDAMVVSPLIETAPVPVLKRPVDAD